MKVEYTDNGDLDFSTKNYKKLNKGLVIFPKTLADVEKLKELEYFIKDFLDE